MAWLRRGTPVRPWTAAAVIAVVAAIAAVVVWLNQRGKTDTGRLLTRIIKYHESQYEINRDRWLREVDRAKDLMDDTHTQFDRLTHLSDDASGLVEKSIPAKVDDWERLRAASRGLVKGIGGVGVQLRAASMSKELTSYHLRMKFYYEGLRNQHVAKLPTLPAALEFERMRIELALRRQYGGRLWDEHEEEGLLRRYDSEPPPHLTRAAPRP